MKDWTFLELIEEFRIKIPDIQRDYAQGRDTDNINEIRKNFIDELINAISLVGSKPVRLNFVYGSTDNDYNIFIPLDGQQRLTTLFLLHWYLCPQKELEVFQCEDKKCKLSYNVRFSSKDFCNQLAIHSLEEITRRMHNEENIPYLLSEDIKNEAWFLWEWQSDPTVKGMLHMLDTLEQYLIGLDKKELWNNLKNSRRIVFNWMPLKEYGLTDDLYVKMNARGKELSEFDKLKSTLEEQLYKTENTPDYSMRRTSEWGTKVDNKWMDLFWVHFGRPLLQQNNHEPESLKSIRTVEAKYLVFFKRMLVYYLLTNELDFSNQETKKPVSKEILATIRQKAITKNSLKLIPELISYGFFNKDFFDSFENSIDSILYKNANGDTLEASSLIDNITWWDLNDKKNLFEIFTSTNKRVNTEDKITLQHRAAYYAVIKFCQYHTGNIVTQKDELNEWIRIIMNLIYNTTIDGWELLISACQSIDKLSASIYKEEDSPKTVLEYFASQGKVDFFNSEQYQEECKKAYLILHKTEEKDWSQFIRTAESFPLFQGCIRALFEHEDVDADEDYQLAQQYWNAVNEKFNGEEKGMMREEFKQDVCLLRATLIGLTSPSESLLQYYRVFDNEVSTWEQILTLNFRAGQKEKYKTAQKDWKSSIRAALLCTSLQLKQKESSISEPQWYSKIIETNLLTYIANMKWCWIRDIKGHKAIYPSSEGIFLDATLRDTTLSALMDQGLIDIINGERINHTTFFKGWDIRFKFKTSECIYEWNQDEKIYLNTKSAYINGVPPIVFVPPYNKDNRLSPHELDSFVKNLQGILKQS